MLLKTGTVLLAAASLANAKPCKPETTSTATTGWETAYTATDAADVAAAAATARTSSPTSKVKGKAFDRIAIIYHENTDYDKALGDPNFKWFADKGITLSGYYASTHPSEPNYMSGIGGDFFGLQNDDFHQVDFNVSSIIDLLEERGISWAAYEEDMPYSGYEGFRYLNQENGANDYVRKHNPPVLYNHNAHYEQRLSQIKNLSLIDESRSMFHRDLKANKLPQWMFITPNMTSDGHDSDVTTAGKWTRKFLAPLLDDPHFMDNTLVVITWDENETYTIQNNILGILLGDAIPHHLVGTTDDNFYNHYSEMATVEANWDLPTLGRWDVGANVYKVVADKTGDTVRKWEDGDGFSSHYWNLSYAGVFNADGGNSRYPAPNLALDHSFCGRPIAQFVKDTWAGSNAPTYYTDSIRTNDGLNPPKGYAPVDT